MMVFAWTYAVAVNFVPSYRDPADKIGDSKVGIENANPKGDEEAGVIVQQTENVGKDGEAERARDGQDGKTG